MVKRILLLLIISIPVSLSAMGDGTRNDSISSADKKEKKSLFGKGGKDIVKKGISFGPLPGCSSR